ncbi:MAG: VOC family protein [Magnetovibrio sp.]|nr:VOC family protein [Magnetovibrio sp.]
MEQRLSLVSLGVNDLKASTAFYEKLGWRHSAANSNDQITFFQLGGIILGLYGRQALAEDIGLGSGDGSGFAGLTLAHNARSKDEVDALLADVEAAGGVIAKPAEEVFWGGYSGYFRDLDGHYWEVAWNPFFPIAEDGSITLPDGPP